MRLSRALTDPKFLTSKSRGYGFIGTYFEFSERNEKPFLTIHPSFLGIHHIRIGVQYCLATLLPHQLSNKTKT
jgi:hypothetical protein